MASLFERYFFDAMANLGSSLGERSADNAARRQSIRARSAIDEMLGDASGADVMSAINNGQQFDLSKNTVLDPNFSLSKATPDGRSVQENAASELLDIKRRGQYPIGSSGSALQALSSASGKTPVSIEDVRMALRKRGVDEDIIEKELGYYNSKIKEQANATLVPQIMSKYNSGDYTGALQDTLTLRQHDPETAGILLSGSVTPRDIYASSQSRLWQMEDRINKIKDSKDMTRYNLELKREFDNLSIEDKIAYVKLHPEYAGLLSKGRNVAGQGKSVLESPEFKYVDKRLYDLNAIIADGGTLSPDDAAERQQLLSQRQAGLEAAGILPPRKPAVDWNDYNQVIAFATQLFNNGATKEQVSRVLLDNMGNGELYRNIVNSWQVADQKPTAQQKQEASFFSDWGPADKRTGAAAGDFGSNGYTLWDLAGRGRQ